MNPSPPWTRFEDIVYRAHHPRWAQSPLSAAGAERFGGRFNRPGMAALYTSLDVKTAWLEAQQGFPFKAQPMTLVAYRVACERVLDLTDVSVQQQTGCSGAALACPWEDIAYRRQVPPSWELAEQLIQKGATGALVPSFAPGCSEAQINLVLWQRSAPAPCRVQPIDDKHRLPRNDRSWQ